MAVSSSPATRPAHSSPGAPAPITMTSNSVWLMLRTLLDRPCRVVNAAELAADVVAGHRTPYGPPLAWVARARPPDGSGCIVVTCVTLAWVVAGRGRSYPRLSRTKGTTSQAALIRAHRTHRSARTPSRERLRPFPVGARILLADGYALPLGAQPRAPRDDERPGARRHRRKRSGRRSDHRTVSKRGIGHAAQGPPRRRAAARITPESRAGRYITGSRRSSSDSTIRAVAPQTRCSSTV